jgi:hypothetical protein
VGVGVRVSGMMVSRMRVMEMVLSRPRTPPTRLIVVRRSEFSRFEGDDGAVTVLRGEDESLTIVGPARRLLIST